MLDAGRSGVRAVVVRPGVVYGSSRGIVGDLLQDAANSLVRVVGSGDNHWPLIYDRDLGELYARLATTPSASGVYHANDEGDETVNDIVAAIAEHAQTQPSIRHVPLAGGAQEDGRRTPTRWRSISSSAARARARSAGRRRCTRSPATPRGCSRNGGAARPRRRGPGVVGNG